MKKYLIIAALLLAAHSAPAVAVDATPAPATSPLASEDLYEKITSNMMCLCGCKATLHSCPHLDCGYAIPARKLVKSMLADGKTEAEIFASFEAKEGESIYPKPKMEGFNILGYILPFMLIFGVAVLLYKLLLKWNLKSAKKRGVTGDNSEKTATRDDLDRKRLDQELADYED